MLKVALRPFENLSIILIVFSFHYWRSRAQVISIGVCPNPPPMKSIDMKRYMGHWIEVEKYWFLPEALSSCVSDFLAGDNGTTYGVEISQKQGRKSFLNPGITTFRSRDGSADLILDLLITQSPVPFTFRFPYFVLDTDYDTYTLKWACTQAGPLNFQYLWILSRNNSFTDSQRKGVYAILKKLGIPVQMLKQSDQRDCVYPV